MGGLRRWWRNSFDVRPGERLRTVLMFSYFFFVLAAVHVLKPVAWALFLNRFQADKLPYLYLLIAVVGGAFAYGYTKLTVKTSLYTAVGWSTAAMVVSLLGFWQVVSADTTWLLYALAIWVNLFGIIFVSQGWLVAANLFDGREAKRLYAIVGLGAIVGAAAGGGVTNGIVERIGSSALLPVGAGLILLSFGALRLIAVVDGRQASAAKAAARGRERGKSGASAFQIQDVLEAVTRHRHLLVIVGIIITTYVAEVMVEFQFNVFAKQAYSGDELTAFLGRFNGIYLSALTFVLQLFFTTLVVGHLGVGRTLLISPIAVGATAVGVVILPTLFSAAMTRLAEASTRYSISRTAIELLYLPLPTELKNRTKAFVDVFVDRLGRGVAALLLTLLVMVGMQGPRELSVVIALVAAGWVWLALVARREYMETVRKRVESRRLDLEDARITVQDTETVRLLEHAARAQNPRQVAYALSLLADAPGYDLTSLLAELSDHESPVVRAKLFELARSIGYAGLVDRATALVYEGGPLHDDLAREAVRYVLTVSDNALELAAEAIDHPDCRVGEAAILGLGGDREAIRQVVSREWLVSTSSSESAERRALAALAVGERGDEGTDALHDLLADADAKVLRSACRAAGRLGNRDYLAEVVGHLGNGTVRAAAIEALTGYGPSICGDLGELMDDRDVPQAVRRQLPRVLAGISSQCSVDILRGLLGEPELTVRNSVLKALGRLRNSAPSLDFGPKQIHQQILDEAHDYYQLHAALTRFRETRPGGKAAALLARTLEDRLNQTIERLFRLLGLRYPPKQIRAAFLAVSQRRSEEFSTALEFLDNILEGDLKDILLPMIDSSPHLLEIGRERFGVEVPSLEHALRHQIRHGDTWIAACAVAAAAELEIKPLANLISRLAENGDEVLGPVARSAASALA